MSISISEPMRVCLDALYEGKPAPEGVLASLSESERAEVASLARTARLVGLSLNQPIPTTEMEASALARAHDAMAQRGATSSATATPEGTADTGNWFTRLFKKSGG
ncbi:MAG: hypothetical protein H7Y38_08655 [Armatimonadetes bacterium]|nr:hypothetical protein [Armatimonadota bacterium]